MNWRLAQARARKRKPSVMSIAAAMPIRTAVDRVVLVLPVPPSKNRLHISDGRGGRIRSPEYRGWIEDAGWRLVSQRPGRVAGPYALLIELPAFTPGDAGNRETAMSDLLQLHNVIDNDSQAQDIRVTRTDGSEFRVTITGLSP